jgi:hypothetical protein
VSAEPSLLELCRAEQKSRKYFFQNSDMTIAEKVTQSANSTLFTLYKEGLFYKCYNEDAMLFVQKVRAFKVSDKFVKSVKAKVNSIGFPASEVLNGNLSFESISEKIGAKSFEVKNELVQFYLKDLESKKGYKDWVEVQHKNELLAQVPEPIYSKTNNSAHLLAMIKDYDLANRTPMQGLSFIQELKLEVQMIDKCNGNI